MRATVEKKKELAPAPQRIQEFDPTLMVFRIQTQRSSYSLRGIVHTPLRGPVQISFIQTPIPLPALSSGENSGAVLNDMHHMSQ
jgi:hypothetical protein